MSKKEETGLAVAEKEALEQWGREQKAPLPLDKSLELYEHFLNGNTTEDIFHLYKGDIPFGQIVDAKERYEWDKRKKSQLASIFKKVEERVVKTKADAVFLLADALAVSRKLFMDKFQKFQETGDPSHLGAFDPTNLKNYKMLLEMFQLLTETKQEVKEVNVGGTVTHEHSVKVKADQKNAAKLLQLLDENNVLDGEFKE